MQEIAKGSSGNPFATWVPYLQDPLVLAGLALVLFFGLARALLRSGLLVPVGKKDTYRLLQTLLLYGFLIGAGVVVLGFGLKYRELSQQEQRNAVELLKGEFNANMSVVKELSLNTATILQLMQQTALVLRNKNIPVLATLFPVGNLSTAPTTSARDMAEASLTSLVDRGLDQNQAELAKANQAARLIRNTIATTRATISSLADVSGARYRIQDSVWNTQLPILRQVNIAPVEEFQDSYSQLVRLRSQYDVTVAAVQRYLAAVYGTFNDKSPIDLDLLTSLLTEERQAFALVVAYGKGLTSAAEELARMQKQLQGFGRAVNA